MAAGIERIYLRSCRGATTSTELILEPARSLVVIFGENGTGKSTLVDAIDMVCNHRCGSLEDRSSATTKQHLPAMGREAADVAVELTVSGRTWTATLAGRGIAVAGPEPRPTAHVLRRSQLLKLVEAQPSQRYETLKRFIDVSGVERSEQALISAARAAQARLKAEKQRQQDAHDALHQLWIAEGAPGGRAETAVSWAAGKAAADTSELRATIARLQEVIEILDVAAVAREPAVLAHAARREKAAAVTAIEAEIAAASGIRAGEGIALIELLQEARRSLASPQTPEACPVCRQPIVAAGVLQQIDQRLATMTEWTALHGRLETATRERDGAVLHAGQCRERFVAPAKLLARVALSAGVEDATGLKLDWSQYALLLSPDGEAGLEAARQADNLVAALSGVRGELARRVETAQTDLNQFHAISQHHERLVQGETRVGETSAVGDRLRSALEIVRAERIAFTQQVLDDVAAECNRLYTHIHPGEHLELARFRLDETKRGSLHQEARFEGGTGVPPQAYFSESHLDTLAFCFFLAIARYASDAGAILVLDDVFTSVDAAHMDRIADLLSAECAHFRQVVVTTHSHLWRDRFRALDGPDSPIQFVELGPWTAETGIHVL